MDKYLFICFSIFQFPILDVNLLQLTQTATELIATQNYYLSIFVIKKKKKKIQTTDTERNAAQVSHKQVPPLARLVQ